MSTRKEMVWLIGHPGAGKTSMVQALFPDVGDSYTIIHFDLLRLAIHGEPYIHQMEGHVDTVACAMAGHALLSGRSVIIDEAITTPGTARALSDVAARHNASLRIIHINADINVCRERRVPRTMPAEDFDRKVTEWGMFGKMILGMGDTVETRIVKG